MQDGLSILNSFVEAINNKVDLSNPVILADFMKSYSDMTVYKDHHKNLAEKNDGEQNLDSLLFLRLLLQDVSHYIYGNQEEIKKKHQLKILFYFIFFIGMRNPFTFLGRSHFSFE